MTNGRGFNDGFIRGNWCVLAVQACWTGNAGSRRSASLSLGTRVAPFGPVLFLQELKNPSTQELAPFGPVFFLERRTPKPLATSH